MPFRLIPGWSDNPWGTGVREVVRMVYEDRVWAIIGGIDGPSTHLAEQVVAKARLALLSPGSTDRTANLANVPWMFSLLPPDSAQAPVLARAIEAGLGRGAFVVVSATDHDSHIFMGELVRLLSQRRLVPAYHFELSPDWKSFHEIVWKITESPARVLVLVAGAEQSARLTRAVREKGFEGLIFGGPCMGQRLFAQQAGKAAETVVFPSLYVPGEASDDFERTFTARLGRRPDYLAAHTYDAVNLLMAAIRRAGLNRARIGDALRELSPRQGVTGPIVWDSLGSNSRPVTLGTIALGRTLDLPEMDGAFAYLLSGFELFSLNTTSWLTSMFSNTSVRPPIQLTSMRSTFLRLPNPKWRRIP